MVREDYQELESPHTEKLLILQEKLRSDKFMRLQMVDLRFTSLFQEVEPVELLKVSAQTLTLDGKLLLNLGEDKDNLAEEENGILLVIGTIGEPKTEEILTLGAI